MSVPDEWNCDSAPDDAWNCDTESGSMDSGNPTHGLLPSAADKLEIGGAVELCAAPFGNVAAAVPVRLAPGSSRRTDEACQSSSSSSTDEARPESPPSRREKRAAIGSEFSRRDARSSAFNAPATWPLVL